MRGVLAAERAAVVQRAAELRGELDQLIQDSVGANADDEHEVLYWSRRLMVSEQVIRDAVKKVGPVVKDVIRCLDK